MKKPFRALATATLLTIMLGSTNTFAADVKNYPGSTCQPATGAQAASLSYFIGVAVNDSSTDSIALDCPIIRGVLNPPISRGRVAVVAQNPNQAVSCTIRSIDAANGANVPSRQVTQTVNTTVTAPGVQHLDFASLTDFGNDSYYIITCIVPPRSEDRLGSGIVFCQVREE
jgi:hypothetical protein